MAPWKGSGSFLLVLVIGLLAIGLPVTGESAAPTEEKSPSSAKECRVHIEKALNQYWDQKEPLQAENQGKDQSTPIGDQQDDDDDDDDDDETSIGLNNDDEDDEEDEEDDENDDDNGILERNTSNKTQEQADDDDDDDDDNDDEDDEDENEENEDDDEAVRKNAIDNEEDDDEEDDDDEDDGDDDDDEETEAVEGRAESETHNNTENPNNDDDDDDDDDDEEEEDEAETDDEEEEDDDDEQSNEYQSIASNATATEHSNITPAKQIKEELLVDSPVVKESTTDNVDTDEDEDDEDDEEDNDEDEDEDDDEEGYEEDIHISSIPTVPISQAESSKVTGETNRTSSGVVSQLPKRESNPQQPKTEKVEEKKAEIKEEVVQAKPIFKQPEPAKPIITLPEPAKPIVKQPEPAKPAIIQPEPAPDDDDEDDEDDEDDDEIENIYEDDDDDDDDLPLSGKTFRNRGHIDVILRLDEIGTEYDKEEDKLAQSIFRDIKKIQNTEIRPIEMLYKYTDSTSRVLGDAEIFNKPMLLFLGPWSSGKTTIINYLLGLERSPASLKTGTGITDVDFTLITYGEQRQVVSGTELAADWRYAGVQRFGQGFLDHFRSISVPHTLLKKITIVDTPGILENKKNTERGYSFNDAFQWFIDRADAIYVVLDPTKVDIGGELGSVVDQLKGREVRFILNKADTIRRSDLMKVVGQLFWNLSPLMSSTEAPVIYAVSLTTKPYHPSAPAKFLADQEKNFLYDMKDTLDKRVENRILYARRHAVRVRNHAKMVDCYLSTYYSHKSIFSSKKNVAKLIVDNPRDYNIFEGLGSMTNISRYDLPDPMTYKDFFKAHPLYDFKPLASTCSYFRGCPMEKLDSAISNELPELFTKYKKAKNSSPLPTKQQGR